jgi:hypothetical protein
MEMYCLYGVGIPTERSYYYLNLESEEVTFTRHSNCEGLSARGSWVESDLPGTFFLPS